MPAQTHPKPSPFRWLKYAAGFTVPMATAVAFLGSGWWTFAAPVFSFVFIPLFESVLGSNKRNLTEAERAVVSKDRLYDALLYLMVPLQWAFLIWFVLEIQEDSLTGLEIVGKTMSFGLLCGVLGINVAHELGHRVSKFDQLCSRLLLLTSLYTHFFIEHNQGHHKHVATPEDAATARYGEMLYVFWVRSAWNGYLSAWRIQRKDRRRKKYSWMSFRNEMLWYQIAQVALVAGIGMATSWFAALYFVCGATLGFLLLETVNYIEHYGLQRTKESEHRYADVQASHSWNSDHVLGRLVLFELTRHSDHHHQPQKAYPLLDSIDQAPQLPAGYPSMMMLSFFPPAWFHVMNKRARAQKV